jgi:hypothetical protein
MAASPRPFAFHYPDEGDPQVPADVAVVTPTLLRPRLVEALRSIYAQQGVGRIQVLLGVDRVAHPPDPIDAALRDRPPHVSALLVALPYSTSARRGGLHPSHDGGALRSILSFMANSRYVAYLDDDNTWEPDHLQSLLAAVQGQAWSHSLRTLIDETTGEDLGLDRWHAVGVGRGRYAFRGGMVDPSCLLIDKLACLDALPRWSQGPEWEADRAFFGAIKDLPHGQVYRPTVRYLLHDPHVLRNYLRGEEPT